MFDEVLRNPLRELAGTHVRYGYRRLTVLLRREGSHVNAKRIYPLYRDEELIVRTKAAAEDGAATASSDHGRRFATEPVWCTACIARKA